MANDINEINKVKYPGTPAKPEFDSVLNWPPTTQVTQTTGEDITRNRNALLVIERILGPNPHIGLFTPDVKTASVSQRLSILEQGVSEGRFEFKKLKVERAIETIRDANDLITLALGAVRDAAHEHTYVDVLGPLRVRNSNAKEARALFDVGFVVAKTQESLQSTRCEITGSSALNEPLLKITDYARGSIQSDDHVALEILGNLRVTGYIEGNFSIDHNKLNNINTDPVIDAKGNVIIDAMHVSRGNYHSHKRGEFNPSLNRWIVNPNPTQATYGIIDHSDLEPQSVRTTSRQQNFLPDTNVAYHVTNGDDHDHVGGDGAPLRHSFFLGIDPKSSDHVTGGDNHTHDPDKGDGGLIHSQSILLEAKIASELKSIAVEDESNLTVVTQKIDELITTANANITTLQQGAVATAQTLSTVKADVATAKSDAAAAKDAATAAQDAVKNAMSVILGTSVSSIPVGTKYYMIGGGALTQASLSIAATSTDQYDINDGSLAVLTTTHPVNFTTNQISVSFATDPKKASTIIPKAGKLKGFAVRAAEDVPSGVEIAVSVWKNFQPTTVTLILAHTGETDIPAAILDDAGEVSVEAGDFITFEMFNRGTTALSNILVAASVGFIPA